MTTTLRIQLPARRLLETVEQATMRKILEAACEGVCHRLAAQLAELDDASRHDEAIHALSHMASALMLSKALRDETPIQHPAWDTVAACADRYIRDAGLGEYLVPVE